MIIEPDVFWSDIALGALCTLLAWLLGRAGIAWWRVFAGLALATFFGAAYHGFINTTTVWWGDVLWTVTLFWFALTSFVLIDESFRHLRSLRVWLGFGLVAYMSWAIFFSEAFIWALLLQAVAIVTIVVRYKLVYRPKTNKATRRRLDTLLVGFLLLNICAIVLQQLKVNFGLPISHNTVFHIIELPVMVILYMFVRGLGNVRS